MQSGVEWSGAEPTLRTYSVYTPHFPQTFYVAIVTNYSIIVGSDYFEYICMLSYHTVDTYTVESVILYVRGAVCGDIPSHRYFLFFFFFFVFPSIPTSLLFLPL